VDAISLNMKRRAAVESRLLRPLFLWEWWRLRRLERSALGMFDKVIVTSPVDRDAVNSGGEPTIPEQRLAQVVANGVDLEHFHFRGPGGRNRQRVVFTGNLGYFSNQEAVRFFLRKIWPHVRRDMPAVRFQVVGDRPSPELRALCRRGEGVELVGPVEDLRPHLWEASVAVSPLTTGSGLPNKVLEAMAAGAPVVTTPFALTSIAAREGREVLVGRTPEEFAAEVIRLLRDPTLGATLAADARRLVEQRYSWEASVAELEEVLTRAVGARACRRSVPGEERRRLPA
jgi:glycosyltransferase involved in cell wall biosynthesis